MLLSIKSEKFTFTLRTSVPGSENLSTTEIPFKQKDNLGRAEAEEKTQLLLPDPRAAQGGQQVLQNMQSDLVYFQRNNIRYLEKKTVFLFQFNIYVLLPCAPSNIAFDSSLFHRCYKCNQDLCVSP